MDLFGFVDMIALLPGQILALQVTSRGNVMSRVHKIIEERTENAIALLEAGATLEVWGWGRMSRPGRRSWWAKRKRITYEGGEFHVQDLEDV